MTDRLTLDQLQNYLHAAGITDDDLIAGAQLAHRGYQKIAAKFGVSLKDANHMVNELITSLRMEERRIAENYRRAVREANERYAYEDDYLKNITIRDTRSGEEFYVSGAEAAELLNALKASPEAEQQILANYATSSHEITEDEETAENDSYEPEIESKVGSYNFPWKDGADMGTATVVYSGDANIRLVSTRDEEGEEVEITPERSKIILRQAYAFIGDA